MELVLNEQQTLLRDSAARLSKDHGGARRARKLRDAGTEIDREAWQAVIAAGWLGTVVNVEHGGLGLGALDLALAVEEAGRQVLMLPLAEAASAAWVLSRTGQTAAVADLLSGAKLIVPATAASSWSFPAATKSGTSPASTIENVAFAGCADAFVLDAGPTADKASIALVPRNAFEITTRRNVDGSTSSRIAASGIAARAGNVLASGQAAERVRTSLHELLVLLTAAELIGTAMAANEITIEYLKLRKQFGKPIGSFQALQHRMVDCFVDLELSRSLLYRVLAAWSTGEHHPAMVSACKARISRGALATVRTAVQMHGAIGYTDEHDIGLYYKRAVALAAKYGNEICQVDEFSALTRPAASNPG